MQRRKFIIGTGALMAGGAAAIGTGAYSAAEMDRNADIDVVNDANGLLALVPGDGADGRVYESENPGELTIDFTSSQGGQGVNVDSRYQVGVFSQKGWATPDGALQVEPYEPAFRIVNNDTAEHTIDVGYECDAEDIGNATVFFQFYHESDVNVHNRHYSIGGRSTSRPITGTDTSAFLSDDGQEVPKNAADSFGPGDALGGVIFVDTRSVTIDPDDLDLSGTLTVRAVD